MVSFAKTLLGALGVNDCSLPPEVANTSGAATARTSNDWKSMLKCQWQSPRVDVVHKALSAFAENERMSEGVNA